MDTQVIKLIAILAALTYANQFHCVSAEKSIQNQLDDCKAQILRSICEHQKINVWSKTNVSNNTLHADEINTSSQCSNLNVNITEFTVDSTGGIIISFNPVNNANQIKVVTMNQWNDIKIGTVKTIGKFIEQKSDSSTITHINLSVKIDSKKLVEFKQKTQRLWAIINEKSGGGK